ncbi:Chaperone protein DnaJ [Spiroplasma poulsonii]|uniref:Chaperone protein DnaJ n=1 Tax=Spiroplasma poulsonii TaxID=2138 RepID=A0A2P6FCT7_9MOLU|nr:Chaperone protein DnaJ [Spiroplasma poulsonii]PQM31256.1 Chaperone protein DnaJ [Spiroplasma poulsonii]PWF96261.1 Chaperone protein DnaJ [Spiroplasma poulsonii]PWF99036.1 Chaperone protein DnaJ [Spiroplasma poulsonii]
MNKNYYTILEISSTASAEEIKENFRRLAKKNIIQIFRKRKMLKTSFAKLLKHMKFYQIIKQNKSMMKVYLFLVLMM